MGIVHAKESNINAMGIDDYESPLGSGSHPCESKRLSETKSVDLNGVVARVDKVHVEGIIRTQEDILKRVVKELFLASNFEDMLKKAHSVRMKLENLGCFRNISIHIDISAGPTATANGYEVTYFVQELRRIAGGVTTSVCNNEGLLSIAMNLPNLWGRGESLKGEYTTGSKRTKNLNLSFAKPYISKFELTGTATLFQNDNEWPMSGYKVIDQGLLLDLAYQKTSKTKHNFQYEGNLRDIGTGNRYAAFEIREHSGEHVKSAVRYIYNKDTRDNSVLPNCGHLIKLVSEFAGLGGNINFLKNELWLQKNWAIFGKDFILQASLNVGGLHEIGKINVCDHFFLGGPLSLRGFEFRSVGPNSGENYIGGKLYWAGALHLYTPLPFRPGQGGFGDLFRTHIFINAGNIGNFQLNLKDFFNEQKESLRAAVGLGVALRLGALARVELNYCYPFLIQSGDKAVQGIQFGVGVHFL